MWVKYLNNEKAAGRCWHYVATYVWAAIAFNFEVISTKFETKVRNGYINWPEKSEHFALPLCGYINLLVSCINIFKDISTKFKI